MSAAVTGGAFYSGTSFPTAYRGAYFYGDYARDWIRYVTVDGTGNVTSGPFDFTTTGDAPVDIEMDPTATSTTSRSSPGSSDGCLLDPVGVRWRAAANTDRHHRPKC